MPKTLMVLEDQPELFQLIKDLLSFEGFEVRSPDELADVVDELRVSPPDAILIDVNLKGANGLDLLTRIRADASLNGLVVLLSSGLDYREESMQRGADGFLMKPYMPADLIQALNDKLQH